MTQEELNDYNRLDNNGRTTYDFYRDLHPEWSHVQIMTMVVVSGLNQRPEPPKNFCLYFRDLMQKAADYMSHEFPRIYEKVKNSFVTIINRLRDTVVTTWDKVIKWIGELF